MSFFSSQPPTFLQDISKEDDKKSNTLSSRLKECSNGKKAGNGLSTIESGLSTVDFTPYTLNIAFYPTNLTLSTSPMPWYVLYTKSRNEKSVADKLSAIGIEVYCPMLKTKRKWSDRIKTVEEPLFRSYCFVRLAEHEREKVFEVPGVVRYLFWLRKPAIVRDSEIEAIREMLQTTDHHHIQVEQYVPQTKVTIAAGAFANATGEVLSQQGRFLTVVIDALGVVLKVDLSKTAIVA